MLLPFCSFWAHRVRITWPLTADQKRGLSNCGQIWKTALPAFGGLWPGRYAYALFSVGGGGRETGALGQHLAVRITAVFDRGACEAVRLFECSADTMRPAPQSIGPRSGAVI